MAGIDVLRRPDRVRRAIGCVAQNSGVDVHATGRENMLLQGRLYGMGGRALEERVDTLLERFGLADAARRVTRTYSGGMQRKLDVAMGLVHRPEVLFLDEPTTGLDPEARSRHVDRDRAPRRRGGAHHPAHDALPRGGRPAGAPPGDRRPRAGSWRRARPTS